MDETTSAEAFAQPKISRNKKGQFLEGTEGVGGRKRGSRNKLGEDFIEDLYEHWQTNGMAAIETVCKTDPAAYLKVIAMILPKDLNVNVSLVERLTNDELNATIARLLADPELAAAREGKITYSESD